MRYLFIDRIERLEVFKQIIAIKNVTLSEDVFADHFFGYPVMPGALLIEALAQAGTALLEVSTKFKMKALLIMVDQAKFRTLVKPGDQLLITMNIISSDSYSAQMDGIIQVVDRVVTTARLTFVLKDTNTIYSTKAKHLMEAVYETWLRDIKIIGADERKETNNE